jgi:hypothetical protein
MTMPGPASALSLMAAPAFIVMSLASLASSNQICASGASWFDQMTAMYVIMAIVHLPPWMRLAAPRQSEERTS